MSEKQAKKQRREAKQARQLMAEFNIRAYTDGYVEVQGPFQNFIFYRSIMCEAEKAVINKITQQANSRIIVPKPDLSKIKLQ